MANEKTNEEQTPKKSKAKLIMIIVPVLLALLGGAYFFLLNGEGAETAATTTTVLEEGDVIEVGDLTVTLADDQLRYAKVGIAVVLSTVADSGVVGKRVPLIQDAAITVLSRFTAAQLLTDSGLDELRGELTDAARALFPDGEVMRVVLTELVIQ